MKTKATDMAKMMGIEVVELVEPIEVVEDAFPPFEAENETHQTFGFRKDLMDAYLTTENPTMEQLVEMFKTAKAKHF